MSTLSFGLAPARSLFWRDESLYHSISYTRDIFHEKIRPSTISIIKGPITLIPEMLKLLESEGGDAGEANLV